MATKKYIIYYNEEEHIVNYCELPQDWKEGDDIIHDNVRFTGYAIFAGTEKNVLLAKGMIKQIEETYSDLESVLDLIERVVFGYMD